MYEQFPPMRQFTDQEFGLIGRAVLLWGAHEQDVGGILAVGFALPRGAYAPLAHALPYSKKVDLACQCLKERNDADLSALGKELDYIKRVFRPERDTLVHGAFGTWDKDAWVRGLSKDRFVIFDDLESVLDRAMYARAISSEASSKILGYDPKRERPRRPADPSGRVPDGWSSTVPLPSKA